MIAVTFDGNITREPDLAMTPSGTPRLNFTVANNHGFGERKGTNWFNCTLWGKEAERGAERLQKGTAIVVNGELATREYERKDGGTGTSLDVRVLSWTYGRGSARQEVTEEFDFATVADDDEDTPF